MGQGGRAALSDFVIGVVAALLLTRVLDKQAFGVKATDAHSFTAMSAILLTVALLASYIPARRASSVDPARSLNGLNVHCMVRATGDIPRPETSALLEP